MLEHKTKEFESLIQKQEIERPESLEEEPISFLPSPYEYATNSMSENGPGLPKQSTVKVPGIIIHFVDTNVKQNYEYRESENEEYYK
jgi:hypothetical protein